MANGQSTVKGEFEVTYFGGPENPAPNGGVNYAAPYTALPPTDLAPGTVNTQSINGFLCSSPWVGQSPFSSSLGASEYPIGIFQVNLGYFAADYSFTTIIVTNVAVYISQTTSLSFGSQLGNPILTTIYTWAGGDLNPDFMIPGQAVAFLELNGYVYMTGLMLQGIYVYNTNTQAFQQATNYVAGRWLAELSGRMVVAQCIFPTGGGTGTEPQPTIAWSGVGVYGQAWDGNALHDVWNAANLNYFSGNIGGFNLLGDVPDYITGMGLVGQSIIIVRNNGLTQQDPNSTFSNSGIQPYNWYHMWSSAQGVGGFVNTVAQWGQMLIFRSYDNVYSLSAMSGLTPIGMKIINKIVMDQATIGRLPGVITPGGSITTNLENGFWNFASIYNLDGELHYLLTFNAYTTTPGSNPTAQNFTCYGYDYNMVENSWHFWDFSQYFQSSASFVVPNAGFLCFSCPLVQSQLRLVIRYPFSPYSPNFASALSFLLFGAYLSLGTITGSTQTINGTIFQLVPVDYDYATNPVTNYVALLYQVLSLPSTKIVFRGEVVSLGHKLSIRNLRILADNAPVPQSGTVQQAAVTFTGASGQQQISPSISMQGNIAPTGLPIRTYYGNSILQDEMVQPSLASVFNSSEPWSTMCLFRLASASLLGIDYTGTQP